MQFLPLYWGDCIGAIALRKRGFEGASRLPFTFFHAVFAIYFNMFAPTQSAEYSFSVRIARTSPRFGAAKPGLLENGDLQDVLSPQKNQA
jgi:hypothetical protein